MASKVRSNPSPRSRAAHLGPERRRPLVLDAAFAVFLEHGYEHASMDAIAARAGVTKPVVYACFASKQALFAALIEREEQRMLTQIAAALPERPDADPELTLERALTAFLSAVADSPDAYRVVFLGEGGVDAATARRIRDARAAQVEAIAGLVSGWLASRGASADELDARLSAHALVGVAEAAARALLAEPERWDAALIGARLARMIARGPRALSTDTEKVAA